VRTFRFRLARVLDERARLANELGRVLDAIASAEGPGSGQARRDLILYEEHLREMLRRAERVVDERRRRAEEALAALHAAVKDRKVLVRLREKRRVEHLREVDRREQATNDESARRLWRQGIEAPGSEFPDDGNDLPGSARAVRSGAPPRSA
jgi:flagellar FliJ-like protein